MELSDTVLDRERRFFSVLIKWIGDHPPAVQFPDIYNRIVKTKALPIRIREVKGLEVGTLF